MLEAKNKILIIRLSSLGDILLTTPFLRSIKKMHPSVRIDFLLKKEYSDALRHNPYVDHIHSLDTEAGKEELIGTLAGNRYDLIIDLQNNFRSKAIRGNFKCPAVEFKKPHIKKFLLVRFKINLYDRADSIPELYSKVIDGFELDNGGLDLFLPEGFSGKLNGNEKYAGICPGSRHFTKMWPLQYYARIGELLSLAGFRIVLFGGRDDRELCAKLNASIPDSLDLSNDNDLLATAADMKKCRIVICNDSGLMHTASAMNVPVAAIFGSTVKEFGFAPYKCDSLILENDSLKCRPCSHIGRSSCPKKHFKCMKEVTPSVVFEKIDVFLSHS